MIQLFVNHFRTGVAERDAELEEVMQKNIAHPLIERIWTIGEGEFISHPKVSHIESHPRPEFYKMFNFISERTDSDTLNILANFDIYFDHTLDLINKMNPEECFALTRWEDNPDGLEFIPRGDSQDCWIFRGAPPTVDCNFTMGRIGCDNVLAHLISKVMKITNPSKSIRAIHLHRTGVRNDLYNDCVSGPKLTLANETI